MKERPILFNGEMVRAVLDGRKTQTRRVVKNKRMEFVGGRGCLDDPESWGFEDEHGVFHCLPARGKAPSRDDINPPYGVPGDRLWVRETWRGGNDTLESVFYRADDLLPSTPVYQNINVKWKPSIHMPRWASRILLEITDIRVERVQDISAGDANAEGISSINDKGDLITKTYLDPVGEFKNLWNSISEAKGFGWNMNPWVWVVEFKEIK